jgi:hypothetical protein
MLHLWPNDSVVAGNWANDSDDGNALTRLWHAVLIELGVLIVYVVFWVAAALLLHRLAS